MNHITAKRCAVKVKLEELKEQERLLYMNNPPTLLTCTSLLPSRMSLEPTTRSFGVATTGALSDDTLADETRMAVDVD